MTAVVAVICGIRWIRQHPSEQTKAEVIEVTISQDGTVTTQRRAKGTIYAADSSATNQ